MGYRRDGKISHNQMQRRALGRGASQPSRRRVVPRIRGSQPAPSRKVAVMSGSTLAAILFPAMGVLCLIGWAAVIYEGRHPWHNPGPWRNARVSSPEPSRPRRP
jgi:hypothetical protein